MKDVEAPPTLIKLRPSFTASSLERMVMFMKAEAGTSRVTTQGPPGIPCLSASPSWVTSWVSIQCPALGMV